MRVLHLAAGNRWTGAAAPAFAEVEALRAAGVDAHYAYVGGYKLETKLKQIDFAHPLIEKAQNPVAARRTIRALQALGPFDVVRYCPHGPDDGCDCRKPAPGMVKAACAELDVDPARCVVVGDIGADVDAAAAAGAVGVLVPTPVTRTSEVAAATHTAENLAAAVDDVLAGRW